MNATDDGPLLSVRNLVVSYQNGRVPAVRDVSFDVQPGTVVAVVGESGSGKSTMVLSALGLLPPSARVDGGEIRFGGRDISRLSERQMRQIRGRSIGLVPQDPSLSLDPTMRIGKQIAEALTIHGQATRRGAQDRVIEILNDAGMDDPARRVMQYPHELSGGMRQRVLIGIAWSCRPSLILADEPTSALDVTVQRQVLDYLDRLRSETGTAVVLVTHDLGIAAERAQHIVVMSDGKVVEQGSPEQVLQNPTADYTRTLVENMPSRRTARSVGRRDDVLSTTPDLLIANHLVKEFRSRDTHGGMFRFRAVDDVSFSVRAGETLSLVGESGSGKTTTARMVMRLEQPTSGELIFDGTNTSSLRGSKLRRSRQGYQMVYQNPFSSLDPRLSVASIIEEPLRAFRVGNSRSRTRRSNELLDQVALPASFAHRRAAELSGGQRQRVAIARALALNPRLLVCDEPVSALDTTVQGQILDLLAQLQQMLGLSYLFISHDLSVVRAISDRIAVMKAGQIVEIGQSEDVFNTPHHDYTRQLIAAIPGQRHAAMAEST